MSSTSLTSSPLTQLSSAGAERAQQRGTVGGLADPPPSREAVVNRIGEEALVASRELSASEASELDQLRRRDDEMRMHEQVHVLRAAGGALRRSFTYVRGADNKTYAVSNSLKADFTPVPNDLEATADKMKSIKRAALSDEGRAPQSALVAGQAAAREREATQELARLARLEGDAVALAEETSITDDREQNERLPRGTGSLGGGRNAVVGGPATPEPLRGTASAEDGPGSSAPEVGEAPLRKGSSSTSGTDPLGDVEEAPLGESVATFDERHLKSDDAEGLSAPQEANELAARVQQRYYPGTDDGGILATTA